MAVDGQLIVDDGDLASQAALDGAGLAFTGRARLSQPLADGPLVSVLDDWCPPFPGFFLYYPNRRQQPAALRALLSMLRTSVGDGA